MTDPTAKDLGRHDAEITNLKDEVKALKDEIRGTRADISEIKSLLDKTRGGWQALSIAAGIAGAIGAAVMKLVFMGNPTPHP